MRQELCSECAHLCPTIDFFSRSKVLVTANGRGYVANWPTCGPPMTLSATLKHWEPPIQQGLGGQSAHLWATCSPPRSLGDLQDDRNDAANPPACWPLLTLSPA